MTSRPQDPRAGAGTPAASPSDSGAAAIPTPAAAAPDARLGLAGVRGPQEREDGTAHPVAPSSPETAITSPPVPEGAAGGAREEELGALDPGIGSSPARSPEGVARDRHTAAPSGTSGRALQSAQRPMTVEFVVPGEPKSKSRHRTGTRGGKIVHYKDEATARAQDAVGIYYRQKGGPGKPDAISGFGVSMVFHVGARQRRDVDNLVKLILDSLTGFAWVDDSQVTEITAKVRHGAADPRSEVTVYPTDDLPDWMRATCKWCGKTYRTFNSWPGRAYCSRACQMEALHQKRLRPCDHCGQLYDAKGAAKTQRYCSTECSHLDKTYEACCANCSRVWRKPVSLRRGGRDYCDAACSAAYWKAHPTKSSKGGQCEVCGAPKSRPEYLRCGSCKRANQKPKQVAVGGGTS